MTAASVNAAYPTTDGAARLAPTGKIAWLVEAACLARRSYWNILVLNAMTAAMVIVSTSAFALDVTKDYLMSHSWCGGFVPSDGAFRRLRVFSNYTRIEDYYQNGNLKYNMSVRYDFDEAKQELTVYIRGYVPPFKVFRPPGNNYIIFGNYIWTACDESSNVQPTPDELSITIVLHPDLGLAPINAHDPRILGTYWCGITVNAIFPRRNFKKDGFLEVTRYDANRMVVANRSTVVAWTNERKGKIDTSNATGSFSFEALITPNGQTMFLAGVRHIRCDSGPVQQNAASDER